MAAKKSQRSTAWNLITIAGIPVRVHYSFFLLLLWIAYIEARAGGPVVAELLFLICCFGCVVLHELGHALTAKHFGIRTEEIVLYPIGGVARLRNLGNSWEEFWITAAGPAVNVVLAVLCKILLIVIGTQVSITYLGSGEFYQIPMTQRLFYANLALAVFNLVPAFPMDGGRLFRSLLSFGIGRTKATFVAVWTGRIIAIGMGLLAVVFGQFILGLIAIFIYFTGGQELKIQQFQDLFDNGRAGDAMLCNFSALNYWDTYQQAYEKTLNLPQSQFPVIDAEGNLAGMLNRQQIIFGLQTQGAQARIAGEMSRNFPVVTSLEQLATVAQLFRQNPSAPVVVVQNGTVAGMITPDSLDEYIQLHLLR